MKYYLIAGEASGDLHGSNLMAALLQKDKAAEFRFIGGDLMAKYGGKPQKHYKEMAFMGYLKVLANLRYIIKILNHCKKDILNYQPDAVILIDYAGFNLKIAKFAFKRGLKVLYYISPKIWAWKTYRIKTIKKYVHRMFSILPFETDFFATHNYTVNYVGNPTNDAIANHPNQKESFEIFSKKHNLKQKPIVALLAGSRKQEITLMLPTMLNVSKHFPDYQFVIAAAPGISPDFYKNLIRNYKIAIIYEQTYQILNHSKAALVTSGTATLETALLNVPQIVCYQIGQSNLVYKIGRMLLKIKYISLVNLILNKEAVKELIQQKFETNFLVNELNLILNNENYRKKILNDYQTLKQKIGNPGASEKAASLMIDFLKDKK